MGRIRLGQRVPKANGNGLRPAKLDVFKFTSAAEHLITEIAALYGGKVEPFTGEGVRGKQFMVLTETNDIPIYLPQQKIDPFYESWAGGVCTRRCDGEQDHIHGQACDCNPDKRACKPTTRVKVMLADVPGLGVWRFETHGIYAAMELSQLASLVEQIPVPLPGRLILQSRLRKFFNRAEGKVETRDYYVPVISIDAVTFRQVAVGGDALSQALHSAAPAMAAVESSPQVPAIEAARPTPQEWDPAVIDRGLALIAKAAPQDMADLHARIVKMGEPGALVDAFRERLAEQEQERLTALALEDQAKAAAVSRELERQAAESETVKQLEAAWSDEADDERRQEFAANQAPARPPVAPVAEPPAAADRGDVSTAMGALLQQAARLRMNTAAMDAEIVQRFGVDRFNATAAQLDELTADLKGRTK